MIGAGFASGQEILQFFVLPGEKGLFGVALAAGLFSYLGAVTMSLAVRQRTTSHREFFHYLFGHKMGRVMDVVTVVVLAGGLVVMLSGSGAVFLEHFDLPPELGMSLTALTTIFFIWHGLKGILAASAFLVPLKIAAIVAVSSLALVVGGENARGIAEAPAVSGNWLLSSILYVSYNMIVPAAVLASLGRFVPHSVGVVSGLAGGIGLGLTIGIVTIALLAYMPEVASYQIPTLFLAGQITRGMHRGLGFLIWLAIVTTAIADAHGIASRLSALDSKKYRFIGTGVTLAALPFASHDFDFLVRTLYPLFGYLGLVLVVALTFVPVLRIFCGRNSS